MVGERGTLTTTETSLRMLERVADRGTVTLSQLVDETDMVKSTVYKHLETLRSNGYLVKHGEQYQLSLWHLTLGKRAIEFREEYELIKQRVYEFGSRTDAEVDFTVEEDGRLILIFEAVGGTNESTFGTGREFCLHNTAAGKAILATYNDDRVDELLEHQGMTQTTANTIQSPDELKAQLEIVREQGYALNDGECVEGYRTVGSVITNTADQVVGAISVGGPVYRIEKSRLEDELAEKVRELTDSISESLSHGSNSSSFDSRNLY